MLNMVIFLSLHCAKTKAICCRELILGMENSHVGLRLTSSLCHTIPGEYKFGPKDLASAQHSLQFCSSSCPASHLWPQHLLKMSQQLPEFDRQIQFADYCNHLKRQGVGGEGRVGRKEVFKMCLFLCSQIHTNSTHILTIHLIEIITYLFKHC